MSYLFFFNDTATTEIYTLSLHDALPISPPVASTPPFHGPLNATRQRSCCAMGSQAMSAPVVVAITPARTLGSAGIAAAAKSIPVLKPCAASCQWALGTYGKPASCAGI